MHAGNLQASPRVQQPSGSGKPMQGLETPLRPQSSPHQPQAVAGGIFGRLKPQSGGQLEHVFYHPVSRE